MKTIAERYYMTPQSVKPSFVAEIVNSTQTIYLGKEEPNNEQHCHSCTRLILDCAYWFKRCGNHPLVVCEICAQKVLAVRRTRRDKMIAILRAAHEQLREANEAVEAFDPII